MSCATASPGSRVAAAVRFRAKLAGQPDPAGEATARVLGGYRRTAADRGRGQAAPLSADGLAAILATAARPRTDGRGVESHTTAQRRGRLDAVIASLLFMGRLRRSEVSALEWRDVSDARDGDGVLLTVFLSRCGHRIFPCPRSYSSAHFERRRLLRLNPAVFPLSGVHPPVCDHMHVRLPVPVRHVTAAVGRDEQGTQKDIQNHITQELTPATIRQRSGNELGGNNGRTIDNFGPDRGSFLVSALRGSQAG